MALNFEKGIDKVLEKKRLFIIIIVFLGGQVTI